MANYKNQYPETIGTIHKHTLKPDETFILLQVVAGPTVETKSLLLQDATVYTVPSGKTFYAVEFVYDSYGIVGGLTLYEGAADTATTLKAPSFSIAGVLSHNSAIPLNFTIAATKTLVSVVATANCFRICYVLGYEK